MKTEIVDNIPIYLCENSKELFELLTVTNIIWENYGHNHWICRGQGDTKWGLEARIYRGVDWGKGKIEEIKFEIMQKEYRNMQLYKVIADEAGLSIPGDLQIFRTWEGVDDYVSIPMRNGKWPPVEAYDTLALIQHHGMQTQFIDFTRNPYVALYFAAMQALEFYKKNENKKMCIWIIDRTGKDSIYFKNEKEEIWPRYAEISAPYGSNPYLKSQKGLFLFDRCFTKYNEYKTIDYVIANEKINKLSYSLTKEIIKKVEIHVENVKHILLTLRDMGISISTLMPSYDNVSNHIKFYKSIEDKKP
jgi:hypothetical protein